MKIGERGPARMLVETLAFVDRFYGPLGFTAAAALNVFMFAPRDMEGAMIGAAAVGSALMIGWLAGTLM